MSKTIAISMMKDERDVVEGCVRHNLAEVDHMIVADNGSTDGTRDILDQLAKELPLTVVDDPDPAYYQSDKMTRLAQQAAAMGATWVVPIDADELWYSRGDRISAVLAGLDASTGIARAALFHHLRTALDVDDADPFGSMVWRQRRAADMPKVAFRWQDAARLHQGNHWVSLPVPGLSENVLEIRHFPVRSAEQMITKARNGAAAYNATTLNYVEGQHWRSWGDSLDRHGEQSLVDAYTTHWFYRWPVEARLERDPAPYRRWEPHGNEA